MDRSRWQHQHHSHGVPREKKLSVAEVMVKWLVKQHRERVTNKSHICSMGQEYLPFYLHERLQFMVYVGQIFHTKTYENDGFWFTFPETKTASLHLKINGGFDESSF